MTIEDYIPKGSTITGARIRKRFGSMCVDVHFTVPEEYRIAHELWNANRIASIKLVRDDGDEGLKIESFADVEA